MLLVVLGELVQTTAGKWIIHPPTRCPNGHTLVTGEVLSATKSASAAAAATPPSQLSAECTLRTVSLMQPQ
jgi:hypothetical protein